MLKENDMKLTRSYISDRKMKLPVEENPTKFLNSKLTAKNNEIKTQLFFKRSKYPCHWPTKVPLLSIKYVITGKLDRAKKNCLRFSV